jgi:hypothetical protein
MTTGSGCVNTTSALRRPPPIADGFAFAAITRLLGLGVVTESSLGTSPYRIGALSAADPAAGQRHHHYLRPVKFP